MKTVFYGGSSYVIPVVDILKEKFGLSLVVVKNYNDPLVEYCKLNNIPLEEQGHLKSILQEESEIRNQNADLAVVADFGVIIPKDLIEFYPKGIINIHPSLLPKFRGPTPVQTALLEGEKTTGVTIIKIDEKVDHGPILVQKEYEISDLDTSKDLLNKLFRQGATLLETVLDKYVNQELKLQEQDDSKATFTKIFTKSDGFFNIENPPDLLVLNNMIRAFYPWPGVWTKTFVNKTDEKIIKFLPNKLVQVEGKKEVNYKDFINGYPDANSKLKLLLDKNV